MIEVKTYLDNGMLTCLGSLWLNKVHIVSIMKYKETDVYLLTLSTGGTCLVDESILSFLDIAKVDECERAQSFFRWRNWVCKGKIGYVSEVRTAPYICSLFAKFPQNIPPVHLFARTLVRSPTSATPPGVSDPYKCSIGQCFKKT